MAGGKVRYILAQKRGETLMEGIASLLVFSILLAAVTMMINWSLGVTADSAAEATEMQNKANEVILGEYDGQRDTELILSVEGRLISIPVTVTDNMADGGFFAFKPESRP
ncbi:MAG: hypothetical protein FWH06_06880 [Oscillospiraceae bacterium]|nr:hypothetical protein [Oscillospiraceae bacterium]